MQRPSPRFRSEQNFVCEISEEMFSQNSFVVYILVTSCKNQQLKNFSSSRLTLSDLK